MSGVDDFFTSNLMPAGMSNQRAQQYLAQAANKMFLRTGIEPLDKHIRLVPGELVFIGGRAASGKTALGMQITRNVCRSLAGSKGIVAFFSAEMTMQSLVLREAAAECGVPMERLTLGEATPFEVERVEQYLRSGGPLLDHLFVDESPAPTLEHMLEQLGALTEAGYDLRLVVFDYLELAGELGANQQERIAKISRGLKAIAKHFNVPVVTLAQLNREIEKRADKKIQMSDFMFGGEQAADIVIGLLKPSLYDEAISRNLVEAHIVKYRNGRIGIEPMYFDEKAMRFSSVVVVRRPLNE